MLNRERQLRKIEENIKRQIDILKDKPTVAQIRILSQYENMIRGRSEFDNLFWSIHAITSLINYPVKEGTALKDAVIKEVIYGRCLTINKFLRPFVIITVYREHIHYHRDWFNDFDICDFNPLYVKSFNPENGKIEVTPIKGEAACFYSKELIDKFHETLKNEEKYKLSTTYGEETINNHLYKKTIRKGEWPISELCEYGEDGHEVSSMWYYPNKYHSEGYIPYK